MSFLHGGRGPRRIVSSLPQEQAAAMPEPMNPGDSERATACPRCGHAIVKAECDRCHGTIHDLGDGRELPRGDAGAWRAFASGFAGFCRAVVHTAHHRAFVGRLRAPVAANVLVVAVLLVAAVLWLQPALAAWLSPTLALQGTLVVVLWLGPTLLEVPTGPLVETLVDATEQAMGGARLGIVADSPWRAMAARLRASARVFAVQL